MRLYIINKRWIYEVLYLWNDKDLLKKSKLQPEAWYVTIIRGTHACKLIWLLLVAILILLILFYAWCDRHDDELTQGTIMMAWIDWNKMCLPAKKHQNEEYDNILEF